MLLRLFTSSHLVLSARKNNIVNCIYMKCSLCGSPNTNRSTCPLKGGSRADPAKHPYAYDQVGGAPMVIDLRDINLSDWLIAGNPKHYNILSNDAEDLSFDPEFDGDEGIMLTLNYDSMQQQQQQEQDTEGKLDKRASNVIRQLKDKGYTVYFKKDEISSHEIVWYVYFNPMRYRIPEIRKLVQRLAQKPEGDPHRLPGEIVNMILGNLSNLGNEPVPDFLSPA